MGESAIRGNRDVSILILLDAILEDDDSTKREKRNKVSILIMLDAILEERGYMKPFTPEQRFNPYSAGCDSGSLIPE